LVDGLKMSLTIWNWQWTFLETSNGKRFRDFWF